MHPFSITSLSSRGLSAVRPEMRARVRSPSATGTASTESQKATPFSFIASAHSANALPGGLSAPAPKNHGSTTAVTAALGTSPSITCLAWYLRRGRREAARRLPIRGCSQAAEERRRGRRLHCSPAHASLRHAAADDPHGASVAAAHGWLADGPRRAGRRGRDADCEGGGAAGEEREHRNEWRGRERHPSAPRRERENSGSLETPL